MSEELNAIFHASTQGRTDIVQAAIDSIRGSSPTHDSLKHSNKTIVKLISTGRAEDNATPIHVASSHGHADVIRALLSAGANLSCKASQGAFAGLRPYEVCNNDAARDAYHVFLFEAIAMSDVEKITRLLDGGVPASVADQSTKDTPLHWAASFGSANVVEILTACDPAPDVNACNSAGQTALHLACKSSSLAVVELLLKNGADMSIDDNDGNIPPDYVLPANFSSTEDAVDMIDLLRNPPPVIVKQSTITKKPANNGIGEENKGQSGREEGAPASESKRRQTLSMDGSECSFESDARSSSRVRGLSADGEDDDLDEMNGGGDGCANHPMSPILVLWPPPQRMNRRSFNSFILSNDTNLTLTAPSSELGTVSLLIETLNGFNFQAEISSPSLGAVIKLSIDQNICPKRNSYELIVDPEQAQLVAADSVGLLYAVHAFVQLMQLHSDLTVLESGVTVMKLPSISISDWPDFESRAVLWSHRSIATHSMPVMKDMVSLLSKLHLNTVLLSIDPQAVAEDEELCDEYNNLSNGSNADADEDAEDEEGEVAKGFHDLSDMCTKHQMKLIPTLVLTSLRQYVPPHTMRHFTGDTIVLNLDYMQPRAVQELVGTALRRRAGSAGSEGIDDEDDDAKHAHIVTKIDVENALKQRCADVISCVQRAGFTTVILVCNSWTKSVAKPQEIAFRFGLNCVERPAALVFPKQLFVKPCVCVKEMIHMIYSSTMRAREVGSSMNVLPAFTDSDCLMPILLIKYHCFLHAGFSWNPAAVADMLGEPADADANVLREVAYLLIFAQQPEGSTPEAIDAVLGMFTGQMFTVDRKPITTRVRMDSQELERQNGRLQASSINENKHMARVDRVLYTLLTTRENVSSLPAITKEEAGMCIKNYRRLLLHAKWKVGTKCSPEMDEFFSLLHLLHTLGKVIIYAYASREKALDGLCHDSHDEREKTSSSEYLTYAALLGSLSPGTNSDTANAFLEGVEHCTVLWKKRFQSIWFFQPKFYEILRAKQMNAYQQVIQTGKANTDDSSEPVKAHNGGSMRFLSGRQVRSNFYRKERQGVPVTAIFNAGILAKLPRPRVVEETLVRLFGGHEN